MTIRIFFVALMMISYSYSYAQTNNDISMMGTVLLDTGVASKDYVVDISVTNHDFVVLPLPFTILRPVKSRVIETVTIMKGQSSVGYTITGISLDAVDYVIKFTCNNCDNVFDGQFYSADGNQFSAVNQVYIDPDDFPNTLDFTLQSGTSISGVISLDEGMMAKKNLQLALTVRSSIDPSIVFAGSYNIVIAQGDNSIEYSIDGITRLTAGADFLVRLQCFNCLSNSIVTLDYPTSLTSSVEHSDIDFVVLFNTIDFLPSVLMLLNLD